MAKSDRRKAVEAICKAVNDGEHGGENKDALTYLGSRKPMELERFSCGCPDLDEAMGGGYPIGRFIELYGPESGGKTTMALHAIAEFQKMFPDQDVALIDTEYSFDEDYAEKLGVKTDFIMLHQPDHGDQALNVVSLLISLGVKLIIVDSVAALTTQAEMEGSMDGSEGLGAQARLMSKSLRRLASVAGKNKATIIWTNQIREKIGVMFGDKTTTPGGRALRFYASVRVSITRIGSDKENIGGEEVVVSNRVKAEVKKNKTAPPFRKAEFNITFGHGIDRVAAILDGALKAGIIEKNGAWFSAGNTRVGQGRAKSLDFLRENEEFLAGIEAELLEKKKPEETPPEETPPEETPPEESGNGDKRKRPVTQKTKDKLSDVSVEDA